MFPTSLATFPTLNTERLILRQLQESDAQELLRLRSDTRVNAYLDRQPTQTVEEALHFIRKIQDNFKNKTGLYWAITQTDNQKLIGTICLFDFSDERKTCEIGYELLPQYQGQGMMNEAIKKIIAFSFQTLGLEKIEAFTHKDNQRSTKLLQKFTFAETSVTNEANPNLIAFQLSKQK